MTEHHDAASRNAALATVLDALLPGDPGGWPAASAALDPATVAAGLAPDVLAAALDWTPTPEGLARAQADAPHAFDAVLRAAYRGYYSAPAVAMALRALAEASPREAAPFLDPSLVARVVATGAGKRRL